MDALLRFHSAAVFLCPAAASSSSSLKRGPNVCVRLYTRPVRQELLSTLCANTVSLSSAGRLSIAQSALLAKHAYGRHAHRQTGARRREQKKCR